MPLGTNNHPTRYHMNPVVEDYVDETFYPDGGAVERTHYGGCMSYVLNFIHMLNRKSIRHGLLDPRPVFIGSGQSHPRIGPCTLQSRGRDLQC